MELMLRRILMWSRWGNLLIRSTSLDVATRRSLRRRGRVLVRVRIFSRRLGITRLRRRKVKEITPSFYHQTLAMLKISVMISSAAPTMNPRAGRAPSAAHKTSFLLTPVSDPAHAHKATSTPASPTHSSPTSTCNSNPTLNLNPSPRYNTSRWRATSLAFWANKASWPACKS